MKKQTPNTEHSTSISVSFQPLILVTDIDLVRFGSLTIGKMGLGSNIGHGLFVGWVEHPDIFCWVSFLYPTYLLSVFVLSAKPNKMAEDRIIPEKCTSQMVQYWVP